MLCLDNALGVAWCLFVEPLQVRRALLILIVLALTGLPLLTCPAIAETITLDFDDPMFAPGDVIPRDGDINFEPVGTVFRPSHVATFSGDQALKGGGLCNNADCTEGYYLTIRFGQRLPIRGWLSRGANSVSLRVGLDAGPGCLEDVCAMYARLVGYGKDGMPVADTRDIFLFDRSTNSSPINREMTITDPSGSARIATASLFVGKGVFDPEHEALYPGQPQIDHLVVVFPDGPTAEVPTPLAPTIQIAEPTAGASKVFPYNVHLKGAITAPGGVYAFCYSPNGVAAVDPWSCSDTAALQANNTFDIAIASDRLEAGDNTLTVSVFDLWGQKGSGSVTFRTLPPPAPVVTIYNPTNNDWINANANVFVNGGVITMGQLQGFCVLVDPQSSPTADGCRQHLSGIYPSSQQLNFGVTLQAAQLPSGHSQISVFAIDRWGQVGRADVSVNLPTDLRIVGMEVTQGIQTLTLPLNINGAARYAGAKLRSGVPTVVRVFANSAFAGEYTGSIVVLLLGYKPNARFGEEPLGGLLPDYLPAALRAGPIDVPAAVRADPASAYVFTLPTDWTMTSGLRLKATLQTLLPIRECLGCLSNNDFSLFDINFVQPPSLTISPVELYWTMPNGAEVSPPAPEVVFARLLNLLPTTGVTVRPYVGRIDITDLLALTTRSSTGGGSSTTATCDDVCEDAILGRVTNFEISNQPGFTIGIAGSVDIGVTLPEPFFRAQGVLSGFFTFENVAVAGAGRPLTSAGHEFLHQIGYLHAGPNCPPGGPPVDLWIWWPPDQRGELDGIGLDRGPNSAGSPGQYRILASGTADRPNGKEKFYDLMSYCSNDDDSDAWISLRNWDNVGDVLPNGVPQFNGVSEGTILPPSGIGERQRAQQMDGGTYRVSALVDTRKRVSTMRVARDLGWIQVEPARSGFTFLVHDATDRITARVPAFVAPFEERPNSAFGFTVSAFVPARGADRIELEIDGRAAAEVSRTKAIPKLEVTLPAGESTFSRAESLRVAWTATDEDSKTIEVRIEFAGTPDKPFRTVFVGQGSGKISLPGHLFGTSEHGRLRVVASDGFNETQTMIEPLSVRGIEPRITIKSPAEGTSFVSTTPIPLVATAFGDDDASLPEDAIEWSVDGKVVGTGSTKQACGLGSGAHVAVAKAREGKLSSEARVAFKVRNVGQVGRLPATTTLQLNCGNRSVARTPASPSSAK